LFEVISGKKEAFFTSKAVEFRLKKLGFRQKSYILMDLGGGSTEIVYKNGDEIKSKSFRVGIVSASKLYPTKELLEKNIDSLLSEIINFSKEIKKSDIFVATAGTPTTIAAFLQGFDFNSYNSKLINGKILSIDEIDKALEELLKFDEETRAKYVGVGREDLIINGVLLFREIMKIFDFFKAVVVDDSLREGVALEMCKNNLN